LFFITVFVAVSGFMQRSKAIFYISCAIEAKTKTTWSESDVLTTTEISAVADYIRHGAVHWLDSHDGALHRVVAIVRNWVEFDGAQPEPAAKLLNGNFVSLNEAGRHEFFHTPLSFFEWSESTMKLRITKSFSLAIIAIVALIASWQYGNTQRAHAEQHIQDVAELSWPLVTGRAVPGIFELRELGGRYVSNFAFDGVEILWTVTTRGDECATGIAAVAKASQYASMNDAPILVSGNLNKEKIAAMCASEGIHTARFWSPAKVEVTKSVGAANSVAAVAASPEFGPGVYFTAITTGFGEFVVEGLAKSFMESFPMGEAVRIEERSNGLSYVCSSLQETGSLKCAQVLYGLKPSYKSKA
jgi:hypothetical protein